MRVTSTQVPIATVSIFLITGVTTGLQFVFPQIIPMLERTPTAMENHEWWRLFTPLLVQSDGWRQIAFNFPAILLLGIAIERIFGSRQVVLLYIVCGFVGEIAGFAWQPFGAGSSIAAAGLLGALALWLLMKRSIQGKVGGVVILAGAGVLTFIKDIHGPPIVAGAFLAGIMLASKSANSVVGHTNR